MGNYKWDIGHFQKLFFTLPNLQNPQDSKSFFPFFQISRTLNSPRSLHSFYFFSNQARRVSSKSQFSFRNLTILFMHTAYRISSPHLFKDSWTEFIDVRFFACLSLDVSSEFREFPQLSWMDCGVALSYFRVPWKFITCLDTEKIIFSRKFKNSPEK